MEPKIDPVKREAERERQRQLFLQHHMGEAIQARFHLEQFERRNMGVQGLEDIRAGLRVLIDMALNRYPAHDLSRRFVSLCMLMPQELHVPFINAVAVYSRPDGMDPDYAEWAKFKKQLLTLGNKLLGIVFALDVEFSSWRPRDPAQGDLFDQVSPLRDLLATPQADARQVPLFDDGGERVDPTTGEVGEDDRGL